MDAEISSAPNKIKIMAIKAREDWEIARQCHQVKKSPSALKKQSFDYNSNFEPGGASHSR
jgi:hypothetical protein